MNTMPRAAVPAARINIPAMAGGVLALNAAAAHTTIASEAQALQSSLSDLQQRSIFTNTISDVTNIDTGLQHASELLESARTKGYAFQSDLENIFYNTMSQWETIRSQVTTTAQQQSQTMKSQLAGVNPMVQSLNRVIGNPGLATSQIRSTQSYLNGLLQNVSRIENDLRTRYAPAQEQMQKLTTRLNQIHWAMDQLSQAKFRMENDEDLVMGVAARWDKEGKEDPEGLLYLTPQRLIFERKEKVATKKVLFITTASELVQEVLIDQPLASISSVKAENKGLFGHQDYLQCVFSDARLGNVALHINGQDSKDWAALIERASSGQIEGERINAGTGFSITDMTKPLTTADLLSLQNEVNALQDEVMLKGPKQELAELENGVHQLERQLAEVRSRGYVTEKDLEADITVLTAQWERVKKNTESTIEYQTRMLGDQMSGMQSDLAQLMSMSSNLVAARPLYLQVKSALASIQAQAEAAEGTVLAQYDEYADEVESLEAHLEWVTWMLEALSTASFQLLATECGVGAVEAVFLHPNWEPENGILFLTDQRLLWEDRVGTFELKVDVPPSAILEARKEAQDGIEGEVLVVQFNQQGPLPEARFQLSMAVANDWLQMIGRARSGGYTQDRAVAISQEELDRVRNAPQACPNCGASFAAPVLRGQTDITCQYCGKVVRI
jgi:predicted  nucleic acid-binding Zn-ribbon protein